MYGITKCHELARELLNKENNFLTVSVGNKEYMVKGIKRIKTNANYDDSVIRTTIICEENSGCIVR